jgi:hypothetical protein
MNANTLYDAFAKISDSLTDTAYEAKKPERTKNFKTIAIAAAALVVAAAAIVGVMALRGRFDKNIVEKDDNILYRSEDGDFVVRVVEPLENPVYINTEWAVLTDSIIRRNTDVFTGAITDITEISMTYRYMDQDVTDYLSLITAEVKDTLKGDLTKKETVTFIFPYSSRMACMEVDPEIGKEYAFYLTKTSELNHSLDYTPIAEYYYCIQGYCMTPLDEPQNNELLKIIGAEEGICGEAFVDSLKNYYSGSNGNVLYRSENGDYTVWKVSPDSLSGVRSAACWVPVNDEMLHRASDVVVGTIKDITDIYIETGDHDYLETKYGVIDLSEVGRYKSLVTVEVKETINGDIAEGKTITFVYESPLASYPKNVSSSLWGDESAIVGRDYVFFLKKTSEKDYKFDLTPIAAYAYGIIGPCFVPYDEPQNASLLETIGAQKGTCGEEFIEAVRKYYN